MEATLKLTKAPDNLQKKMMNDEEVTVTGTLIAVQNTDGKTEEIYLKAEAWDTIKHCLTKEQIEIIKGE